MRGVSSAAFLFVLLSLLAACTRAPPAPPTASPTSGDACSHYAPPLWGDDSSFSGQNAFGHVLELTCDFSQNPPRESPRVPGTPGRERAARYIAEVLSQQGWNPTYQNFTAQEYEGWPKGSVAPWASNCPADAREHTRTLTFSNLVGEHGGSNGTYILLAHYESKRSASQDPDPENRSRPVLGANDGASGVGVLLEASRVLAHRTLDASVRLLLVDGEDGFEDCHPLAGSIAYAQSLSPSERERVRGVWLLDMVGDAEARYCLAGNDTALAHEIRLSAEQQAVSAIAEAPACHVYDDHTAFLDVGLASIDLIDYARPGTGFPPYWHTTRDTPDKLSTAMLGGVGSVVVATVTRLAGS